MPFGKYKDFNECVKDNKDKGNPEAYCASLHYQITGKWPTEMMTSNRKAGDFMKLKNITVDSIKKVSDNELLELNRFAIEIKKNSNNLPLEDAKKFLDDLQKVKNIIADELFGRKMNNYTDYSKESNSEDSGVPGISPIDYFELFKKVQPWQIDDAGRIVSLLQKYRCKTVLDVGCGSGWMLALLDDWFDPVGLDMSESVVESVRRKNFNAYVGFGDTMPFVDGMFDAVITNHVLQNSVDADKIIRECARVTRRLCIHIVPLGERQDPTHVNEFITLDEFRKLGEVVPYPTHFMQTTFNNAIMVVAKSDHPFGVLKDYSKITLVDNYISQVGSSVKFGSFDDGIEISVKDEKSSIQFKDEFLSRAKDDFKDSIKFIYNNSGPNGIHLPLYDLALVPKEMMFPVDLEKEEGKITDVAFVPPKPEFYKNLYVDKDYSNLWFDWAEERKPVAVSPKYNGFRGIIMKDANEDVIIFFENSSENKAKQFPDLVKQAKKIPRPFIFDCDFSAVGNDGKRLGRVQLIKFNSIKDIFNEEFKAEDGVDGKLKVTVNDVLLYGDIVTMLFYKERRKIIDSINFADLSILEKSENEIVRDEKEFVKVCKSFSKKDYSEGVLIKDLVGEYRGFNDYCKNWAEARNVAHIRTRIKDVLKSEMEGAYVYEHECKDGKEWFYLGKTVDSKIKLKKGDIIEVQVEEIVPEINGKKMEVSVAFPIVLGKVSGTPDSVHDIITKGSKANILQVNPGTPRKVQLKKLGDSNIINHNNNKGEPEASNKHKVKDDNSNKDGRKEK
jgi:ubiquinone/menaquinone biosynthesis C-methylase UbiE